MYNVTIGVQIKMLSKDTHNSMNKVKKRGEFSSFNKNYRFL